VENLTRSPYAKLLPIGRNLASIRVLNEPLAKPEKLTIDNGGCGRTKMGKPQC
jgi:hypothetical protein